MFREKGIQCIFYCFNVTDLAYFDLIIDPGDLNHIIIVAVPFLDLQCRIALYYRRCIVWGHSIFLRVKMLVVSPILRMVRRSYCRPQFSAKLFLIN